MSGAATPVERDRGLEDVLVPITLELSPIRLLLIIDLADDPTYRTLEPQVLEGQNGDEVVLLAYRHDGCVELYAPAGSTVTSSGYDGLGGGLRGVEAASFEQSRCEVAHGGLRLDLALEGDNGRRFDLHLREHLRGPRDRVPLLAPVGGAFEAPTFFPFLWLPGLSFVPARRTQVDVRVDGRPRSISRLPLPIGGRRCLMARYDPDVLVCMLNPDQASTPTTLPVADLGGPGGPDVDVVGVEGGYAAAAVRVALGGYRCAVRLDPPMVDPRALPVPSRQEGRILLEADDRVQLRGRYELVRSDERAELVISGFTPWRSRTRRPLLAVLFRLPIFRRWPTSYRWRCTFDPADPEATRHAEWTR